MIALAGWIMMRAKMQCVVIDICWLADSQKKLCNTPLKEPAFINSNWKDATARFINHEKSMCHKIAVDIIVKAPSAVSVGEN